MPKEVPIRFKTALLSLVITFGKTKFGFLERRFEINKCDIFDFQM